MQGAVVGREPELNALDGALAVARHGDGRVVSVSGEPGIGKTTLVRAFSRGAAEAGITVVTAACFEGSADVSFGPWTEVLRGLGRATSAPDDTAADDIPAASARLRFFTSVLTELTAAATDGPIVVIVDDLHWASRDSLELFGHVALRIESVPLLLVGTHRAPDLALAAGTPLGELAAVLARAHHHTAVELHGLDRDATGGVATQIVGGDLPGAVIDALRDQTSGNPFFVREVARSLVADGKLVQRDNRWLTDFSVAELGIPANVRLVVQGRVAALSEPTQRLLTAAAAFSGAVDLGTVRDVSGLDDDASLDSIDEALAAGLLVATGDPDTPYAFAHAIVRHALLDSMSPDRAARLHRRSGAALEARHPERHADIAEQYWLSRGLEGAEAGVPHLVAAATVASRQHAYQGAAELWERARTLTPASDPVAQLDLTEQLAIAQARGLDPAAATATVEVLDAADPSRAAELVVTVAEALRDGAPPSSWEPLVERAVAGLGDRHDATWARVTVLRDPVETITCGAVSAGRWTAYPAEAAALLHATDREEDEARAIEPFQPRTVDETAAMVVRSRTWTSPAARQRALDFAGRDYSFRHGLPLEATACYLELLDVGRSSGSIPAQAEAWAQLALMWAISGRADKVDTALANSAALVRDLWPSHRLHLLGSMSNAAVAGYVVGDADWPRLAEALTTFAGGPPARRAPFAAVMAALGVLALVMSGDAPGARALATDLACVLEQQDPFDHAVGGCLWFAVAAIWELDDTELADRYRPLVDRHTAANGSPGPFASLELAAGRLEALAGRRDRALELVAAAGATMHAAGCLGVEAQADIDRWRILRDEGSRRAAIDACERAGLRGWRARVAAAPPASGAAPTEPAPPPPPTTRAATGAGAADGSGLTKRETEVLALLATGRTTKEIASELVLSAATVNRHIANIYTKIDVRNRAEATAYAIARGLLPPAR